MNKQVINIENHDKYKGYRGKVILPSEYMKASFDKYRGIIQESSNSKEGVNTMDVTQKEYIDQRIDSLEKSIEHRFNSTDKLFSEKMDHLATRLEGAINNQNTKLDAKFELIESAINNQDTKSDSKINLMKSNLDHSLDVKLTSFKEEFAKSQKSTRNNIIAWILGGGAILATVGVAVFQYISG